MYLTTPKVSTVEGPAVHRFCQNRGCARLGMVPIEPHTTVHGVD